MYRVLSIAAAIAITGVSYVNAAETTTDKTTPSATMTMECTDADMMKMNTQIDGMKSADNKKMAMDHMAMAKDSMAKKDMSACAMHMKEAHDAMGKN